MLFSLSFDRLRITLSAIEGLRNNQTASFSTTGSIVSLVFSTSDLAACPPSLRPPAIGFASGKCRAGSGVSGRETLIFLAFIILCFTRRLWMVGVGLAPWESQYLIRSMLRESFDLRGS